MINRPTASLPFAPPERTLSKLSPAMTMYVCMYVWPGLDCYFYVYLGKETNPSTSLSLTMKILCHVECGGEMGTMVIYSMPWVVAEQILDLKIRVLVYLSMI